MSNPLVLMDAGPLAALIDRRDRFHQWARQLTETLPTPCVTSESVVSEAAHILRRGGVPTEHLFNLLERQSVLVAFNFQDESKAIATMIAKYADVPMSVADATLVRLSEIHDASLVFTIDSDFRIYRKHGRWQIPLIIPDGIR